VFYVTPCNYRLRSDSEVDRYLIMTNSQLTIDLFSFDSDLRVDVEFMSKQVQADNIVTSGSVMCQYVLCSCMFVSLGWSETKISIFL